MNRWTKEYIEKVVRPFFEDYVKREKHGNKLTANSFAKAIGLSSTTANRILNGEIKEAVENQLYEKFGIEPYKDWKRRIEYQSQIFDNLVNNYWLSYRFTSKRQLYISSWIFKEKGDGLEVRKRAPKGLDFKGKFILNKNFHLSGTLSTKDSPLLLSYQTYFPAPGESGQSNSNNTIQEKDGFESCKSIILDSLVKHGDEIYGTTEILIRERENPCHEHDNNLVDEISNRSLLFQPDKDFRPSNLAYLAYNFLTRFNPKSRVIISNRNHKLRKELYYQHTIRVACPVRSISNPQEFERVLASAKAIKKVLLSRFKFPEENIYFELAEYTELDAIKAPNVYLFEKNRTISYTHSLVLLPKLQKQSMGVFAEIFYRMGKKLPVAICYEDESSLSYVLANLTEHHKLLNVFSKRIPLEDVAGYIQHDPEWLLAFRLP